MNEIQETLDVHGKAVEAATMRYCLNLIDRLPITKVIETLTQQTSELGQTKAE